MYRKRTDRSNRTYRTLEPIPQRWHFRVLSKAFLLLLHLVLFDLLVCFLYIIKSTFFNKKSGFLNRKSGFLKGNQDSSIEKLTMLLLLDLSLNLSQIRHTTKCHAANDARHNEESQP